MVFQVLICAQSNHEVQNENFCEDYAGKRCSLSFLARRRSPRKSCRAVLSATWRVTELLSGQTKSMLCDHGGAYVPRRDFNSDMIKGFSRGCSNNQDLDSKCINVR